jgi:uncharacterized membrane protein
MKKLLLASAVSLAVAGVVNTAVAQDADMEKCFGVVKAGQNDCASKAHSCAGQSASDGGADEWVNMPKGLCAKLVNGKVS